MYISQMLCIHACLSDGGVEERYLMYDSEFQIFGSLLSAIYDGTRGERR